VHQGRLAKDEAARVGGAVVQALERGAFTEQDQTGRVIGE